METLNEEEKLNNLEENETKPQEKYPMVPGVAKIKVIFTIIAIVLYIFRLCFNTYLVHKYYVEHRTQYCAFTVISIIFPSFIITSFCIQMYWSARSRGEMEKYKGQECLFIGLLFVFPIMPVFFFIESARYASKCRQAEAIGDRENQKLYFIKMLKNDRNISFIRIVECFLEVAPQLILQIAIMLAIYRPHVGVYEILHNIFYICNTFVAMAWAMANYQRMIYISYDRKPAICGNGTFIQFLWHFLITISRILIISMIASVYPVPTIICIFIHWILMSIWLFWRITIPPSQNDILNRIRIFVFAFVYVYTFITLERGKKKRLYSVYYTLCFIQNITAIILWCLATKNRFHAGTIVLMFFLHYLSYFGGLGFMVFYYKHYKKNPAETRKEKEINLLNITGN